MPHTLDLNESNKSSLKPWLWFVRNTQVVKEASRLAQNLNNLVVGLENVSISSLVMFTPKSSDPLRQPSGSGLS